MVDEYQDTNRPQYLLIRRLAEVHRNLCVVGDPDQSIYKWRGADLRNILDFEHDFPEATTVKLEQNYRSTQIILDAASAVINQNRNRKDKHLWTDRKGGARIVYFRGGDELEEADFITRTARAGLADDVESTVAVLYRTNAQSRTIEDALMREGLAYKVVGGVRFYERKEIKDALAYMRLVINPHDDVSLRRVINVPARGIGKGVMDTLAKLEPADDGQFSAPRGGPQAGRRGELVVGPARSRPGRAHADRARRIVGRGLSRSHRQPHGDRAAGFRVDCDRQDARSQRISPGTSRGSHRGCARRESKTSPSSSRLRGSMRAGRRSRRSADLSIDCRSCPTSTKKQGSRDARIWLMTLHSAKGLEFPMVILAGLEEGLFPHSRSSDDEEELEEERRLCYVGMTRATAAARAHRRGPPTRLRRIPVERALSLHRRGAGRARRPAGADLLSVRLSGELPALPVPHESLRRWPWRARERKSPVYAYENEDQSTGMALRPGMRVRHAQFGVGSVITIEPLDDDTKLVVRFNAVGVKTLRAKFAKLEPA